MSRFVNARDLELVQGFEVASNSTPPTVILSAAHRSVNAQERGDPETTTDLVLLPEQARELARALLKAAQIATESSQH